MWNHVLKLTLNYVTAMVLADWLLRCLLLSYAVTCVSSEMQLVLRVSSGLVCHFCPLRPHQLWPGHSSPPQLHVHKGPGMLGTSLNKILSQCHCCSFLPSSGWTQVWSKLKLIPTLYSPTCRIKQWWNAYNSIIYNWSRDQGIPCPAVAHTQSGRECLWHHWPKH